ncbi:ribose-phosphate pyrophosphokinase [Microbulbifer magnicolonia]|uniref:ribose-phosphate pyrophosphokinase n=1 Tax=Microbulbifer magnicolonia TaxID=3109744 RepID=UPI002B4041B7|nr:ribose-phosphate pyrophosphokinase [Microbulbifer sp. GG15]
MAGTIFSLHPNRALAAELAKRLGAAEGRLDTRHFPDGESYFRVLDEVRGQNLVLLADLHRPDRNTLPALLLAGTLRDLGAESLLLAAPYLPYMRQDKRFHPGEGVTSRYFARLVSTSFDGLVTVDPHLHRYASLAEIYTIPALALQAAPLIAEWIAANIDNPLLIGPDSESAQWVEAVAGRAGSPFTVLHKVRHGDRDVEVSAPDIARWRSHTPVLVDDIVSSGHTMLETLKQLQRLGLPKAVCIGVHGVFAGEAATQLASATTRVVTSNSIPHPSNAIDIAGLLADGVRALEARG